eukprot:495689-Pelagomonas_calceolata.AAC.5
MTSSTGKTTIVLKVVVKCGIVELRGHEQETPAGPRRASTAGSALQGRFKTRPHRPSAGGSRRGSKQQLMLSKRIE